MYYWILERNPLAQEQRQTVIAAVQLLQNLLSEQIFVFFSKFKEKNNPPIFFKTLDDWK